MMDAAFKFCDAQVITTNPSATSVTSSTNVADLEHGGAVANKDTWGNGIEPEVPLMWNVTVSTAISIGSASGNATFQLLCQNAAASIKSGTEIARITLTHGDAIGTRKSVMIPPGLAKERYLGVAFTINAKKATAGAVNSWLGPANEKVDVAA